MLSLSEFTRRSRIPSGADVTAASSVGASRGPTIARLRTRTPAALSSSRSSIAAAWAG